MIHHWSARYNSPQFLRRAAQAFQYSELTVMGSLNHSLSYWAWCAATLVEVWRARLEDVHSSWFMVGLNVSVILIAYALASFIVLFNFGLIQSW